MGTTVNELLTTGKTEQFDIRVISQAQADTTGRYQWAQHLKSIQIKWFKVMDNCGMIISSEHNNTADPGET